MVRSHLTTKGKHHVCDCKTYEAETENGSFSGTLTTLALHAARVTITPVEGGNEKAPAYRVYVGDFEAGAVWKEDLEGRQCLLLGQARRSRASRSRFTACL
jgi:uncharacterized protein DUF736